MAEPTPPPADPASADPPADNPTADPPAPAADASLDAAALQRELAEARREAAKYRTDARTLAEEKKVAEQAKLTDEEKRTARIAELERTVAERETALQERTSYAAVVDAAARLGAAKPAMIHRLIAADIEYEDDGSPKNVDALVRDFLKANPEFVSTAGRPTGDAGQGARGKGSTLTRDQIKGMSNAEVNRRWDEVQEVLKSPV